LRTESKVQGEAPPCVILLGASNATRGISAIVDTARQLLGGPIDVRGALGHGRSYGIKSRVLLRGLPGISRCGLWESLRVRPSAPAFALLTDLGNDILYEVPVPRIAEWVAWCLDRLQEAEALTTITLLPTSSLERLTALHYYTARAVFFPSSRLSMARALAEARELNHRLEELAAARNISVVKPRGQWYGLDPIHIQIRHSRAAWGEILRSWQTRSLEPGATTGSFRRWVKLQLLRPERWSFAGFERSRAQPCGTLPDSSTISLY